MRPHYGGIFRASNGIFSTILGGKMFQSGCAESQPNDVRSRVVLSGPMSAFDPNESSEDGFAATLPARIAPPRATPNLLGIDARNAFRPVARRIAQWR